MSSEPADISTTRTRASDAEREEVATIVREAVGEGRLDIAEGDQRLASIYAAKYRDELAPLVTDLPAGQHMARAGQPRNATGADQRPGQWGPGPWGQGAWGPPMAYRRDGRAYRRAYQRGVLAHTGFVVILATALTLLWVATGVGFFWPAIPLFFIVMGLARHWRWATWRRYGAEDDRR
jgi:uncharacterized protein DUF1707